MSMQPLRQIAIFNIYSSDLKKLSYSSHILLHILYTLVSAEHPFTPGFLNQGAEGLTIEIKAKQALR